MSTPDPTIARLEQQLHTLMMLINRRSAGTTLELMHEHALTLPQMVCLNKLHFGGPVPVTTLGSDLKLSASAVSGLVDKLVEKGFVDRWEHPEDRRARLVGITDSGRALVSHMAEERAREFQEALGDLDPAVRAQLVQAFDKVIAELGAGDAHPYACRPPHRG